MSVTWNDTTITGSVLVDQDEMIVLILYVLATPLDGTLICRSENTADLRKLTPHSELINTISMIVVSAAGPEATTAKSIWLALY